jgi:hypothetical protein
LNKRQNSTEGKIDSEKEWEHFEEERERLTLRKKYNILKKREKDRLK